MQSYQFDYYQYKKKINKPKTTGFVLLSFLILIALGLAMFLYPNSLGKNEFYFVEINSFLSYNEANDLANTISSLNGAGYVYYDGKYHVFASFYPSKKDAETVCENLKSNYPLASVYTLECDKFYRLKSLSDNQNKSIENLLSATLDLINSIYKCIINFDTDEISINQLFFNLDDIKSEFIKYSDDFFDRFKTDSKYNKAKKYVAKIVDTTDYFEELKEEANEQSVSQKLKYKLIDIVINHSCILNSF